MTYEIPEWEEAATLLQLWISFSITKKVCCFQIWKKVLSDFVIRMLILTDIFAPNPTTICMWRDSCLVAKADSPPEKGSGQTEPGLNGVLWFYQTRWRWWDCYNKERKKRPQHTRKGAYYIPYTLNQMKKFYIPCCWIALCGKRKAMSDLYSRRTLFTIKFPFAAGTGSEHGKYTCYNQEYQHDNNDEQQEFKRLKLWFREILYKNT